MSDLRHRRPATASMCVTPTSTIPSTSPVIVHDKIHRIDFFNPRKPPRPVWCPSFSVAFRILLLVRMASAMYSNIDDCDEVYNFWEPLHFIERGTGFQTWEVSPQYALRSWAYIFLHYPLTRIASFASWPEKRPVFFAVRMSLATICVFSEVKFYRSVVEDINRQVGRYLFLMLLSGAGMWNASTSFLPSSFAMYMTMFAFSYAMRPPSILDNRRSFMATFSFAVGAILGWPFALALAIPFVFEELFITGVDRVSLQPFYSWMWMRWKRFLTTVIVMSLFIILVVFIDSAAYGRFVVVPWNIIHYNIFSGPERGPHLYGTSRWFYYFFNLFLNFNFLVPLALLTFPALVMTYFVDSKRLNTNANGSSPITLLAFRLAPFYLWLIILTSQAHKEERFMFPVYPLLCFNAAVTLYLIRGWLEVAYVRLTSSPYRASRSNIYSLFTATFLVTTSLFSLSRCIALWEYYHAPMTILFKFESEELPRLANVTGLYPAGVMNSDQRIKLKTIIEDFDVKLCIGKEWHRFPGNYLLSDGVAVQFLKSEFNGLLPGRFSKVGSGKPSSSPRWWLRHEMVVEPEFQNDLNLEEPARYVPVENCDYLIDLDFPLHPISSPLEPRYAIEEGWERVYCKPFIDGRHSLLLTRAFWVPGERWQKHNSFGDYCLLKNRKSILQKETVLRRRRGIQVGN